jgi:chemotaxis-related protein WspD
MSIDQETLREATERVAAKVSAERTNTESAFIFRLGTEWFALPTASCDRVIDQCSVHSIPHRSGGVLLGVGNVAGDLVLVVSLPVLFGLPPLTGENAGDRMMLFAWRNARFALPVSEIFGVHRFHPEDRVTAPATLAGTGAYSTSVLKWNEASAGFLDPDRLYHGIVKGVS